MFVVQDKSLFGHYRRPPALEGKMAYLLETGGGKVTEARREKQSQ